MPGTSDILKNQLRQQQGEYNGLSPQFGQIALNGAQSNPAQGMFDPSWYQGDQQQVAGGLAGAEVQDAALAGNADQYDQAANNYDQFANGVGAQLEPGLQKQQGAADAQRSQADYLWKNPGYTDQEKQSMMTAAGTPIAGSYTAAGADLRNQAARTGNSAALGANTQELARNKARDLAMSGLNMQGQFANQRIQGQQFANEAMGNAGQAQGSANSSRQGAAGLQSNIFNTGAGIRQGGANIRMGAAGSNLQRSSTANANQGTMQNAGALSMAPYQLGANMYGTIQNARNGVNSNQTGIVTNANNNSFGTAFGQTLGKTLGQL